MHLIGRLFCGGLVGVAIFFLLVGHSFVGVYTVAAAVALIAVVLAGRAPVAGEGFRLRSLWNIVPVMAFAVAYYLTWF
ncbi:hypothetical protein [Corynebacterium auriscanis]|uniref:hypothetical protein n=1 Tax=Corynebacterium auriscanis TaxID=99807 RepID=UPI0008A5D777|nr:hypothetical protein [Corynebacterium auriscanis]MCX2162433.1 hypothetical protein [Corynebacterium auriscanis]OFT90756.1 hypothetical protein HMPREF3098_02555 [Corynebacterium sp. HMSC28B08]